MPLQDQELEVAFGQGLDTKNDPKAVVPGKLLMLENGIFTEGHRVNKRWGYDAFAQAVYSAITGTGVLGTSKLLAAYNNELVCASRQRLYSYAPTLGAWVDKGPYESIIPSQLLISAAGNTDTQSYVTQAVVGTYKLIVWQQRDASNTDSIWACIVDTQTGCKIYNDTLMEAGTKPTAVVFAGATLGYVFISAGNQLKSQLVTISGGNITWGSLNTLTADLAANPTYRSFDAEGSSVGGVVCYSTSTGVKTLLMNASGVAGSSVAITTAASTISVTIGSDDKIWVYFSDGANNGAFYYAVYQIGLTTVLGKTTIASGIGVGYVPVSISSVQDTAATQTVVYCKTPGSAGPAFTTSATVNSSGTVTATAFSLYSPIPASKPFIVSGNHYVLGIVPDGFSGSSPSTVFMFNMDSKTDPVATLAGYACSKALQGTGPFSNGNNGQYADSAPGRIYMPSSTQVGCVSVYLSSESPGNQFSVTSLIFDFDSSDAYRAIQVNNQLILNGGIVHSYDGNVVAEQNFNSIPEIQSAESAGVGVVTYAPTYVAIYRWTDAQNNINFSGVSAPSLAGTGGSSPWKFSVLVNTPLISTKDPGWNGEVLVSLYRNASSGGTIYYYVSSQKLTYPPSTVTFTDNTADVTGNAPLYITGDVLQNTAPPPAALLNSHNNRVWAVDSTNPNTVWYSKTAQLNTGVSFAGDALSVAVDAKGGDIGAIAELDDKQVLFKKLDKIAVLYGDGANDTGQNSTLSTPQFLQTDVGCTVSKSVLSQPDGIIFKSPKGWYLLDRSTQAHYIGFPVESYNSQDVTSAVRIKDKTLCVFLTSSGSALVYDYFYNQWGTFTNHTGYSADIFKEKYTYLRTDGAIYTRNDTSYLDNTATYLLRAQTSWLNLGKIQGFQRVRQVWMLGAHLSPNSGHGVQISAAYDFISTFGTPVQYTFTQNSTDPFQYRQHLSQQKCDTISLLIEEVASASGASGEYIDFTDLGFDAALKKGPSKMPSAKSVG